MKKLNIYWIFLLFILFIPTIKADTNLTEGLVFSFNFSNDTISGTAIADALGYHNGTVSGTVTTAGCMVNDCQDFEADDNDEITIGLAGNIPINGTNTFTITYWQKMESLAANQWPVGSYNGGNDSDSGIMEKREPSGGLQGQVYWRVVGDGSYSNDFGSGVRVDDGNWWHITLIRNGSDCKVYLNATYNGSTSDCNENVYYNQISVGDGLNNGDTYDGLIDQLHAWEYELTAALITDLYRNESSGTDIISELFAPPAAPTVNWSITAIDNNTAAAINNFNVTVNGTFYETTTGTISTSLYRDAAATTNLTLMTDGYETLILDDINITNDYEASPKPYFKVNASNIITDAALTSFNITINGSQFNTTTGQIITNILFNAGVFNITIVAGSYYDETYLNYNVSGDLIANLTPYFSYTSALFLNFSNYSGNNYTRVLGYQVNLSCPSWSSTNLSLMIDNIARHVQNLSCINSSVQYTVYYNTTTEGLKTTGIYLNTSESPAVNNELIANTSFIWDLYNPRVYVNFSRENGFNDHDTNITIQCEDNRSPLIYYNLTFNSDNLFLGNITNNSYISNISVLVDGLNNATGLCYDFFGVSTDTISEQIAAKTFNIVDEKTGLAFDLTNLSAVRLYFDDNFSFYDLKGNNTTAVNFTGISTEKLRFEFVEYGGSIYVVYVDVSLMAGDIRICANKDSVTRYNQHIISADERAAILKNVFADCVIAADYTRFAYQDGLLLKAYSIKGQYYLYTLDDGSSVYLASLDGSVESNIDISVLEFKRNAYEINILGDSLTFERFADTTLMIRYLNIRNNNEQVIINIENLDDNTNVLSTSETSSPDNFTIYFDYSTFNVTNTTLFQITLSITDEDGETSELIRYFNILGQTGRINAAFAFIIALLLTAFGLTYTITRVTFSWLGIVILLGSIGILSLAVSAWYITLLMIMDFIVLIFIAILMSQQNYSTVA